MIRRHGIFNVIAGDIRRVQWHSKTLDRNHGQRNNGTRDCENASLTDYKEIERRLGLRSRSNYNKGENRSNDSYGMVHMLAEE